MNISFNIYRSRSKNNDKDRSWCFRILLAEFSKYLENPEKLDGSWHPSDKTLYLNLVGTFEGLNLYRRIALYKPDISISEDLQWVVGISDLGSIPISFQCTLTEFYNHLVNPKITDKIITELRKII